MLNEKTLSLLAACAVTVGGLAIVAPAVAQNRQPVVVTAPVSEDIPIRRVSYRDLNLATTFGEKALFKRVGYAVRDVCIESVGADSIFYVEMSCRKDAWSGARPQIAQATQRAREIAQFGHSSIPAVAISISVSAN